MMDEIHFIEFSKFNKINTELLSDNSITNMDSLSKWLTFFQYPESYLTLLLEANNNIRGLKNTYDLCEKTMYDEISAFSSAKKEGFENSKLLIKISVAKALLNELDINTIIKITGSE